MRVLGCDPGAERFGFVLLSSEEGEIKYERYGYCGLHREGNEGYQDYRARLIAYWDVEAPALLNLTTPTVLASEIVPPIGGSMPNLLQRALAATALTVLQTYAVDNDIELYAVDAKRAKKAVTDDGKASKAKVRNAVIDRFPDLAKHKKEWTKIYEVPDAFAIGLTAMEAKQIWHP